MENTRFVLPQQASHDGAPPPPPDLTSLGIKTPGPLHFGSLGFAHEAPRQEEHLLWALGTFAEVLEAPSVS